MIVSHADAIPPIPSKLFGFCFLEPMIPHPNTMGATTTDYTEWTYPDGGSKETRTRDSYKDTDEDKK